MNKLEELIEFCDLISNFGNRDDDFDWENAPIPTGCEVGNELVQVKFRELPRFCSLSLFLDGKCLDEGFVGEVLQRHPEQAHNIITDYNWFYGKHFVIRLKSVV